MSATKIQKTRNYKLFDISEENRPQDRKKHQKLYDSMKLYGFLRCFPVVVAKNSGGQLIIKDGQHRLMVAEELGLEVWWVEEGVEFDVAVVNSTAKIWTLKDYAGKYAANSNENYTQGLEFARENGFPVGRAFALLAGTTNFSNIERAFCKGDFVIKDLPWAQKVATLYGMMTKLSPLLKSDRFVLACMAVCRVKEFESRRLLQGAERCREKLIGYSTRDAYLDMIEELYNFGRKHLVGLKAAAMMAVRERQIAETPSNGVAAIA